MQTSREFPLQFPYQTASDGFHSLVCLSSLPEVLGVTTVALIMCQFLDRALVTLPEFNFLYFGYGFIFEADGKWHTPDPNEAKNREALRTKGLLKEFNAYLTEISQSKAKKLKEVRVEALRAGFKNCCDQKDFKTIVILADMIPQNILLEDEQLLMYYDIAKDRV